MSAIESLTIVLGAIAALALVLAVLGLCVEIFDFWRQYRSEKAQRKFNRRQKFQATLDV